MLLSVVHEVCLGICIVQCILVDRCYFGVEERQQVLWNIDTCLMNYA
jgi:hypothetical protein